MRASWHVVSVVLVVFAGCSAAVAGPYVGKMKPLVHRTRPGGSSVGACADPGTSKLLFGDDDRIDLYQETDPLRRDLASATCALIMSFRVHDNEDGTYGLSTSLWREEGVPACPEEPFSNQPYAAFCSGFLIAPDLVATAGHCPESGGFFDAEDIGLWARVVFGFVMEDADTPVTTLDASQVYTPIEIVAHGWTSTHDYAVLRLDRPVTVAEPLTVRTEGVVPVGTALGTIGHPAGLPLKLAFGPHAAVLDNKTPGTLATNVDVYPGNSGGPVFHAENGTVEGIVAWVIPEPEFLVQDSCLVSATFSETEEGLWATQARFLPTGEEEAPANDDCANALPIGYGDTYEGVTFAATTDGYTDCASDSGMDVWHVFTPTVSREVLISTEGSAFDSVLSVYQGCGGTEAACNDDAGNQRAKLILPVVAGETYIIRVAGYGGQSGHYRLSVGEPPPSTLELLDMAAEGWDDVTGLDGAMDVAVSPDGRHVYFTGVGSIAAFTRDPESGSLTFLESHFDGVDGVDGLDGGYGIVVSPDGAHVYAVGEWDDAIAAFARDAETGRLTFLDMYRDTVLDSATGIAMSPDGKHLYVASKLADTVTVFSRDETTGLLTLVEAQGDGLDGAMGVAVSPDGQQVYATCRLDDAVAVFLRDTQTGRLTRVQTVTGVDGPGGLALSPEGTSVYVAAYNDNAVAVYARDTKTGLLALLEAVVGSTGGAESLAGARDVAVSPDGLRVYATGEEGGALVTFARDPETGFLTHMGSEIVLLNQPGGPFQANGLAVTPDARHLYVASWDGTVSIYQGNSLSTATIVPTTPSPYIEGIDTVALTLIGDTYPPYQWFKDDVPLLDADRTTGTQWHTLTLDPVEADDTGAYHAVHATADGDLVSTEPYYLDVDETNPLPSTDRLGLLTLILTLAALGVSLLPDWKQRQRSIGRSP